MSSCRNWAHRLIGGPALQPCDRDGPASLRIQHAGALAQLLPGTHASARATERVGSEDQRGRALHVAARQRADEPRYVDASRASHDAGRERGRSAAQETPVRFTHREPLFEGRVQVLVQPRRLGGRRKACRLRHASLFMKGQRKIPC